MLRTIPVANMNTSTKAAANAAPPKTAVAVFIRRCSSSARICAISENAPTRLPVFSPTAIMSMSSSGRILNFCRAAATCAPSFTAVLKSLKRSRRSSFFTAFSDIANASVVGTPDASSTDASEHMRALSASRTMRETTGIFSTNASVFARPSRVRRSVLRTPPPRPPAPPPREWQ